MRKIKSSIYKGVSWCEADQRWRVHVYFNKRQHGLGNFKTEEETYQMYVKVNSIIHPNEKIKNIKNEIWKDFELYGNPYSISNKGRMKSFNYRNSGRERLLRLQMNPTGYYTVVIKKKTVFVHVLVANYFLGYRDMEVNHKDRNRGNNLLENLEYVSNRGNVCHGVLNKNGNSLIGAVKRRNGKYGSEIKIGDKRIWLGISNTEEEANVRYLKALKEYGFIDDYNYIKGLLDKKVKS